MPTRTSGTLKNIDSKRYLWNAQLSLVGGLAKRRVSAKFLNNLMVYRYSSVTGTGTTGQLGQVRLAIHSRTRGERQVFYRQEVVRC